jgi:hypothetical protein
MAGIRHRLPAPALGQPAGDIHSWVQLDDGTLLGRPRPGVVELIELDGADFEVVGVVEIIPPCNVAL